MNSKRKYVLFLVLLLISMLFVSCGNEIGSNMHDGIINIYEKVRNDAANGHAEDAQMVWKETIKNKSSSEVLSKDTIRIMEQHDILLSFLPCFYLPENLSSSDILKFCDAFCWMFYDMKFYDYQTLSKLYPAKDIQVGDNEPFYVFEKETVEKLASDFFGLYGFTLNDQEVSELQNYFCNEYPAFKNYFQGNIAFCYIPHDPDPQALKHKSAKSLGDGLFYVVFEQGWYYDGEEPTILQDLHLVIRIIDNFFGYEVVSVLQNSENSLL